jgi:putative transposase
MNPVRAQFCAKPEDYRWSSHRCHAFGETDPLVTLHRGYTLLGTDEIARQERYRAWFRQRLNDEQLAQIRAGV